MGVVQRWQGPFRGVVDALSPTVSERHLVNARMRCFNFGSALKRSGPNRSLPAAPSNSILTASAFVRPWGRPGCWSNTPLLPPPPGTAARWQRGLRCGGGGTGAVCGDVVRFLPTPLWAPLGRDRAAVPAEVTMLALRCAPRRGDGVSGSQMWGTVGFSPQRGR